MTSMFPEVSINTLCDFLSVQVDLVCYTRYNYVDADGKAWKYVLHAKDHHSKFSLLRPLQTKSGAEVRSVVSKLFAKSLHQMAL